MTENSLVMHLSANKFLATDESILGEYKAKKQLFVATDRRLIMVKKNSMMDASYNHINSISMMVKKRKSFIYGGILLFIIGIIITSSAAVDDGIAVIILGLILISLYFILKKAVYMLSLSSGKEMELTKTKKSNVESFIKIIRDKIR